MASALSSHAVAAQWSVSRGVYGGNYTQDGSGNLTVTGNLTLDDGTGDSFTAGAGNTFGNFTVNSNVLIQSVDPSRNMSVPRIWKIEGSSKAGQGATVGTIDNQGTILIKSATGGGAAGKYLDIGNNATLDTFINSGTMRNETGGGRGQQMFIAWENGTINNLINKGTIYGYTGVINSKSGTIKNMLFSGPNSVTEAGSGNVIDVYEASNIGTITVENQAKIIGNISLSNTSSITNGITIINSGSLQGNISLTNNARIQGGIVLDDSNMTGNIALTNSNNTMSIDNISLTNSTIGGTISLSETASDYNKSTNTLTSLTLDNSHLGGISLTGNSLITNGIMANSSTIDNITLKGNTNSGTKPTIVNGVSLDNSEVTGDISLNNSSVIMGGFTLGNNSTIANLNILKRGNIDTLSLNQGTIAGNISLTGNNAGETETATIGEITLANSSTITGNISVKGNGTDANANAKIGNIILEDGTGIGGSIAVGDTNGASNTNGEITGITLKGDSTIAGGIINNTNGNIGTIISNTGTNINNTITNHGTIGSLEVNNQGTIVYRSDSGIITDTLSVAEGATLDIKNIAGNTGTIELKSDSLKLEEGSTLNLANGSTLVGHLKNSGNLGSWTNYSNIQGHFINTGTIGILNAGSIQEYLENTGFIQTLKQGKITGTLNNTGTIGELNTSVINYTNGNANTATIAGAGHYGILNIDKNTIMENNNTITNALNVQNNNNNGYTLTINNGGSGNGTLYFNSTNGTIDNAGTILGNIDNQASSTIKSFNTGSISGSIINNANATIETLNVTGNVTNGITNDSNIGSLIVNENVSYSGSGSISNALEVAEGDTLTIGGNGTLNFDSDNGTINNAGTINGNITNIADSILTDFTNSGSISGTFTNKGHIVKFVNESTGSINNFVNDNTISFFENNGIITRFNGNNGTIYGVINSKTITNGFENVATSLWNKENALIQGNVALKGDYKDCSNSGGTICKTSDLINEGTITGNVTNDKGKEINLVENTGTIGGSIANSGSINTFEVSGTIANGILNDTNASISSITIKEGANLGSNGITNHSNIGSLIVNESVKYNGNGSDRITQALEVAKDKTLTIQNSGSSNGTLSFNSKNGNINNLGTIAGNLSNVKDSTITNFINSGTISGNLYNDGHIDTLSNTGTMGTIYNTSKETIVALGNGKGATIEAVNNTGNINIITNDGTINGQITSKNNSEIQEIRIGENGIVNAKGTLDSNDMQNKSNDAVSLDTINTTLIDNQGTIKGNVRVVGQGSVIGEITNQDTISGCILVDGGRIGNINNANGAIANCMSFSSGANVDNISNSGTIKDKITNNSGSITINNGGSGFIGGITTSGGGTTNISNGGFQNSGGNIGFITNNDNSTTNIIEWNVGNPDNPKSPIKVAGDNLGGINTGKIYLDNVQAGKIYDTGKIVVGEDINGDGVEDGVDANGDSLADQLNNGQGIFDSLHHASDIITIVDEGGGEFSAGIDEQELSGKTLGASLIYSSRMRQIDTNNMLREINVKNFKTDFEILEQRERLKNQQALLENYKQQRESYLNGLTKDNKELKRVSSKESTSLSTYANNSNIKSDAIEVVDYYNKDTLASLDNLQATTKANQETYSNLDLLRELDDIFISHTGDKDNLYTFALPYTRYTSAQLDGGVGTLKSHASGILAGAQAKLPSERGILGIYFGYESSDKQVGQQRLDFDEKVYYGGLTYYNVFARKGVSEYYLSANTRIDKGDTNLYKTYRSGSTTIDSQVDSYGYGADLKVGANYYNIYNNSVLSPEIGVSYQGISTDSFRLRHLGGVSEHYYTQDVNFFDISASLRWQRAWNNVFKTMASLGAMYNVYNDAKGSGVIAGLKQSADINVEELYGTTQVGISYALGENANIALNYSGIFANGVQSHAGYIRLGVWW